MLVENLSAYCLVSSMDTFDGTDGACSDHSSILHKIYIFSSRNPLLSQDFANEGLYFNEVSNT